MFDFNFLRAGKCLENGKQSEILVQKLSSCEYDERNVTKRVLPKLLKENCGRTEAI